MGVEIRRYRDGDGEYIAEHIRRADRREIHFLSALKPLPAIRLTIAQSEHAWTATVDGRPAAIFGVCRKTRLSDTAMPWLLATEEADRHMASFARLSRKAFDAIMEAYPVLENYALAENVKTLRWLKWLGFDMQEPQPHGCMGAMFVRFGKGI